MPLPSWLLLAPRSGGVTVIKDGKKILQLAIEEKVLEVNLEDTPFIKDLLKIGVDVDQRSVLEMLKKQKTFAEELKKDGLTITLAYKNEAVLSLGARANPGLTQLLTFSKSIEIKSFSKLIKLFKDLK